METKSKLNRFAAVFLALAMLLTLIPFSPIARAEEAASGSGSPVHILDSSKDLPNKQNKGDIPEGTTFTTDDGYFTIYCGKDARFDTSGKKFDDGYEATQRINFNGGVAVGNNAIGFKTGNAATVKIWWVANDANREIAILDSNGTSVAATTQGAAKGDLVISTLKVAAAGSYFLGGTPKSNYIFKVEVTEEEAAKEYILDSSKDLPNKQNKGDIPEGTTYEVADFFTVYCGKDARFDTSGKKFDDGYEATQRINFNGGVAVGNNAIGFKTSGAADVKVWWVANDAGREIAILDSTGATVAVTAQGAAKGDLVISTLKIPTAGTYYLGGTPKSNYIFKVSVTTGGSKVEREDWAKVEAPVITSAAQTADTDNIVVKVNAVVGAKGGDAVKVTMLDKDGKEIETKQSLAEKDSHELTFSASATGTYTFKAVLVRDGETDKASAANATASFKLTLKAPVIASATSMGGGKMALVWSAVPEADSYKIYCNDKEVATSKTTAGEVSGLTTGTKYSFAVSAVRGTEEGEKSAPVEATATANAQNVWSYTIYGVSTNTANNGYIGNVNEDGKVTVYSEGGHGKIVGGGADGVMYYYTAVPNDKNFVLRAKMHVDSWTWSNGQEAMGMMASDSIPEFLANPYWTNVYYLTLGTVAYRWDAEKNDITTDTNYPKYDMRLGLGVYPKLGITPDNWDKVGTDAAITSAVDPNIQYPLDVSAAVKGLDSGVRYNIAGNITNTYPHETLAQITDFDIEIRRNNTGYFFTYYDENGKVVRQQKFYDRDALSVLDKDNVYVGFFAARNARATFTDIQLDIHDPSEDPAPEEKPVEKVVPSLNITSASVANSPNYTLMATANVNGTADISVDGTVVSTGEKITAGELFTKVIKLAKAGNSKITIVFTPDPNQDLGEDKVLASTDAVTSNVTVNYNTNYANQKNLYVAPNGTSYGNGSAEHPLDIYTAVKVAQPGQTIIIMEGTYNLTAPVRIERGVNGTADKPILMAADPNAKTVPVFDFGKVSEGFRLGGNYWYIKGFEVTNSADKTSGFRVCGNNNTLDQIVSHHNGNSGIQISSFRDSSDPKELWPQNNLILNCTAYNNDDSGHEDADGFAAKLTCGEGNVFDGCVSYNNADDGWDLYARSSSGNIGSVTIKNCIAYGNGYLLDGTNAGNGNGFKLGGENLAGGHKLINSIAFNNKADGITSNSCPDVQVIGCTSYNNGKSNLNLYTNLAGNTTNYVVENIVSCNGGSADSVKKNATDTSKVDPIISVTADKFESTTFPETGVARKADGTIDLGDFLKLKADSGVAEGAGADLEKEGGSTPSEDVGTITPDKDEDLGAMFKDNDSKIEANAPVGSFDNVNDITFNADPVAEETDSKKFTYELNFTDKDGNKVQPNIAVKVAIPVPDALKDKTIYVYHVENDGTLTAINSTVENGMVIFSASKFSKYVLTSEAQSNPETGVTAPIALAVLAAAGIAAACIIKRKRG